MATLHIKKEECHTYGFVPKVGAEAPAFYLTKPDLSIVKLSDFAGKRILLNVFPSIDTNVCFDSVKKLDDFAKQHNDVVILCVSMDLPFALCRVAKHESIEKVTLLSDFRNRDFGSSYGLTIEDSKLAGLLARAVIIIDETGHIIHADLVDDISQPADIDKAISIMEQ